MGNIGLPELIFILVLALLIFGPKKLPEVGKQVGKALGDFKRASNDLKRTIEDEMEKAGQEEAKEATKEPPPEPPVEPAPPGTQTESIAEETPKHPDTGTV